MTPILSGLVRVLEAEGASRTNGVHAVIEADDTSDWDDGAMPGDDFFKSAPEAASRVRVGGGHAFQIGDHVEIGTRLVTDLGGPDVLVHDELHPWKYTASEGLWRKMDRGEESRIVQGYSGMSTEPKGKPLGLKASDVAGAIKLAHDQITTPGFFADAPSGIAFANGFLRVTAAGAELVPLAKEHRARAGYPFAYAPGACPRRYLGFIDSLFCDDEDRHEKTSYTQEFFGACLLGIATSYQRATVATGGGANGKSTHANIMLACMPEGTTSAIPPQDWHQEYRRALLVGVRLNAPGELPERDILESEPFKAIVAGDLIVGRVIRESPVMFRPIAGHYFPTNSLPGTPDQTDGFWRRIVVLTYNRSFTNDPTCDRNIAASIIAEERPAIVSWLIDGAIRLLRNGEYTIPPSHHAALAAWRKAADQVALFVDDELRVLRPEDGNAFGVPASELYTAYLRWAERNRHRALASNTFGKRMKLLKHEPTKAKTGWRYPLAFLTALDRADG